MKPRFRPDFGSLRRKLPALALVSAVALLLAWVVVRSAAVNAFARVYPQMLVRLAPDDPRTTAGLVSRDLQIHTGMASAPAKRAARDALRRAPLMDDPFLIAGIDRLTKRQNRAAREMVSHALARNPRNRLSRLFMLELELRTRDTKSAAKDMTILARLLPDIQSVFVPELARMARDPQTSPALAQALRDDPAIMNSVLYHLATKGARPEVVLRLAGDRPPPVNPDSPDWRRGLLDAMVARGDVIRANRLWALFAGLKPDALKPGVYDGNFTGAPGLPPFNWSLSSSEMGAAERDKSGALQVEYYGRTAGELASQMILLPPGRYRLSFHAEGDLSDAQPRLLWRVQCRRDNRTILELPMNAITYAGRTVAGDFAVPAQCPSQWLRLAGEPTEFPKIESVLVRDVRIRPLGGAS